MFNNTASWAGLSVSFPCWASMAFFRPHRAGLQWLQETQHHEDLSAKLSRLSVLLSRNLRWELRCLLNCIVTVFFPHSRFQLMPAWYSYINWHVLKVPAPFPTGVFVRIDAQDCSELHWGLVCQCRFLHWQGEHEVQTPFRSIPIALWWAFSTMTTVGGTDARSKQERADHSMSTSLSLYSAALLQATATLFPRHSQAASELDTCAP